MINMNHLRSFYTCALHKNVTKAAEDLGVSQPSVSQQIKSFEEEIGFPLFYRNGRTLEMTSEGKQLFNKSQSFFDSIIGIEDFIKNRAEFSGAVHLNTTSEIERPFIARITAELIKSAIFKDTQFFINSVENTKFSPSKKNVAQLFLTHEKQPSMKLVEVFSFPVKLISSIQNIDIGSAKTYNLKSLLSQLGQRLIVPSRGHKLRTELDQNLEILNYKSAILMESNIMACLTEAVREGLGCSLLPIQYIYEDVRKNKLSVYGPAQGFWEHKLYLYSSDEENSSVNKELTRIIQKFSIQKGG